MSDLIKSARATIGTCDCPCQDPTIERLCKEIERLMERLELWPVDMKTGAFLKDEDPLPESCDGISCRDETIKQQDGYIERLQAKVEELEGAARKTLKEQDEADEHHSAACMNWALLEHSQHQCGMCDLREALEATEQGESND